MSGVLILAICSNHKVETKNISEYYSSSGVGELLSDGLAPRLYDARRSVRNLITSDKVSRNGVLLRDMPFNSRLVDGLDFLGKEKSGLYLPALQRYDGRFYEEFGSTAERSELAKTIKHHLLIVSGLYGLLTPTEPTQCYSCHVPDHPGIAKQWTRKTRTDLLTQLMLGYIEKFGIVRVFGFMAVDAYRNLISWEMVRHATKGNVFHCYSPQYAGPALLPTLGHLAKQYLTETSENQLLTIKAGQTVAIPDDDITFLPFPMPEPPLLREIRQQQAITSTADKIGRMRRNILRFLDKALVIDKFSGFGERANQLRRRGRRRDAEVAALILFIARVRNRIEYDNRNPFDDEWQRTEDNYAAIHKWAQESCYSDGITLEEVGL